jgi:hypothetical protein
MMDYEIQWWIVLGWVSTEALPPMGGSRKYNKCAVLRGISPKVFSGGLYAFCW